MNVYAFNAQRANLNALTHANDYSIKPRSTAKQMRLNTIARAARKIAKQNHSDIESIECLHTEDVSDCISFVRVPLNAE